MLKLPNVLSIILFCLCGFINVSQIKLFFSHMAHKKTILFLMTLCLNKEHDDDNDDDLTFPMNGTR